MCGLPSKRQKVNTQHEDTALLKSEEKLLSRLYTKGPAAYGGIQRLQDESGLSRSKVMTFLQSKPAYTKYLKAQKRFPRLKVIAFRINEIWSMDLAYVDKLSRYNKDVKYLLVAVDVLSRYVRVQPLKDKFAATAMKAFAKMLNKRVKPEKVWTDKGTEFKGQFEQFCKRRGIETYTTHSETKSAFAERNIRSLKNIIYRHLEEHWTYAYILHLQEFVQTINTRVNRVTNLAPSKVTKKDVAHLVSLTTGSHMVKKPKFKLGDVVRIAKEDLPFKKGYKQNYTDEVFEISDIPTINPPTYQLVGQDGEEILGKFYEKELTKTTR
jgi:hypothetical protein